MICLGFTACVHCDKCGHIQKSGGYSAEVWNYKGSTPCPECGYSEWSCVIARQVSATKILQPSTWFSYRWEIRK